MVPANNFSSSTSKGTSKLDLFSSYTQRFNQTPNTTGTWLGERAESVFMPNDPDAKKLLEDLGLDGIKYKNAIPDFSPVSKAEFEIVGMSSNRTANFAQADEILAKQWGMTTKEVTAWRSTNGYTWHELNDMKTVQLVPSVINSKCGHLGGVGEINIRDGIN